MAEFVGIVIVIILILLACYHPYWAATVILTLCGISFWLYARRKKLFQTLDERKRREEQKLMAQQEVLTTHADARQKAKDKMRPMIVDASLSCRNCNSLASPITSASQNFAGNRYRCIRCKRQFAGSEFRLGFSVECIMREEYEDPNRKIYAEVLKEFGHKVAKEIMTGKPDEPGVLFAEVSEEIAHERA